MKITVTSTDKVVVLRVGGAEVPARIWQGETESGIRVHCFITRIAISKDEERDVQQQFERELQEQAAARAELQAIPLRLIL